MIHAVWQVLKAVGGPGKRNCLPKRAAAQAGLLRHREVPFRKPLRSFTRQQKAGPPGSCRFAQGPSYIAGLPESPPRRTACNHDPVTNMSNATQHSRNSGDSRRRRSRGGKKHRNPQQDGRRTGDRGPKPDRVEEFRPKSGRPKHAPVPVKLSWWQKILKAIGLYKEPAPKGRPARQGETGGKQQAKGEARPAKSNVRNARTGGDAAVAEKAPSKSKRSRGERPRGGDGSSVESSRVYVGNLSYDVSEQDLQELFKGIGGVRNVEIVYNRSTHRSKGYGFVEMLHQDEAVRAVEVLHDQFFMGRKMVVSGAKSKGQDEREDKEERSERPQRPVTVAPLPAAEAPVEPDADPVIQTIVETVKETPDEQHPAPVVEAQAPAETPAPVEAAAPAQAEAPAESIDDLVAKYGFDESKEKSGDA
jgi:hypothetical protein